MRATLVASTTTRTCKLCRGSGCLRCARTGLISDDHEAFAFQADWTRWDIMVDHDEASVILVPLRGKTQGYRWTTQQARELALALTDALNKLDAETLEYGAIHG